MAVSIDKNKLIDQAQKYIQKGQFDRAISEYQKIVEADSKDIRTRLKLGEMYLKIGNNAAAVNEYSAAAESYTSDGFILQAIAVFKQLLKINPSILDIYVKLARLYKKQGLIADALAQYRIVISNYEKQGKTIETIEILKEMTSMDPENFNIRAKLADLYLTNGEVSMAMEEFSTIAADLKNKGRMDDVITLYQKLLSSHPRSVDVLIGLGEAYLETGKTKAAQDSINVALKSAPNNTKALLLQAKIYIALNDDNSAILTYENILNIDQSSDDARKGLARLFVKEGKYKEGMEVIVPFIDKALEGKNFDGALSMLLEFYRNDIKEPLLLEKMAYAYKLKGETVKETAIMEELAQLTEGAPELEEIMVIEKVPFEAPPKLPEKEVPIKEPTIEEHFVPAEEQAAEPLEDAHQYLTEAEVYVKYGLVDKAIGVLNTALQVFPNNKEVRDKLVSLGVAQPEEVEEELQDIEEISMEVDAPEEEILPDIEEVAELDIDQELVLEIPEEQATVIKEKDPLSKIKEDLEEADFYIQQGLYEDARNICKSILETHQGNEETLLKLKAIDDAMQSSIPVTAVPPTSENPVESFFDLAAELDGEEFATITTPSGMKEAEKFGFEDIFSEFKKGVDSQLEKEDTETHYNLGIAYKEMGLHDDAIREFKIASSDPKKEFDCVNLIGICYIEKEVPQKAIEVFKRGLQLPGIGDNEYASMSYELGTAYELAGMTDEALSAYMETSKKNSGFRDVQSKISQLGGSRETKRGRVSYV